MSLHIDPVANASDQEALKQWIKSIRAGALTPSQMEDVVYAIHAGYMDHHSNVFEQLSVNLEDVGDSMVIARKNSERFEWEEEPLNPLRSGHVHAIPLERAL